MSWASKILSEKERLYGLSHRFAHGLVAYYFILVDPVKEQRFLRTLSSKEPIELTQYGEIVASGWGEAPPALIESLKKKYNFN
jgi:hypothetical protein